MLASGPVQRVAVNRERNGGLDNAIVECNQVEVGRPVEGLTYGRRLLVIRRRRRWGRDVIGLAHVSVVVIGSAIVRRVAVIVGIAKAVIRVTPAPRRIAPVTAEPDKGTGSETAAETASEASSKSAHSAAKAATVEATVEAATVETTAKAAASAKATAAGETTHAPAAAKPAASVSTATLGVNR